MTPKDEIESMYLHYGNTGCRVFKWGVQNWKDFCLKINIPWKEIIELWELVIWGGVKNWANWFKIDAIKKCVHKLIFFNEKKTEKDSDEFWCRKLTLKAKLRHFFDTSPLHQFSKFNNFLWVCTPPAWKLENPYYHNLHFIFCTDSKCHHASANLWRIGRFPNSLWKLFSWFVSDNGYEILTLILQRV